VDFGTEFKVVDAGEVETLRDLLETRFPEIFDTFYKPKVRAMRLFLNTVFPDERLNVAKEILRTAVKECPKTPYISAEKRAQKDGE
jgi:hypothetical protein